MYGECYERQLKGTFSLMSMLIIEVDTSFAIILDGIPLITKGTS
jgi:hypothetical protein